MAVLEPGNSFPPLRLQDSQGRPAAGPTGETLYAFFKTTCPTCELTWPYLERLRVLAGDGGVAVVAVSQDDPARTEAFNERLSTTRIWTLYDPPPWRASDAVGATSVPTLFLVADGRIRETLVGFEKRKWEDLAVRAAVPGREGVRDALFRPDEKVPALRPG
ncbi:MAG: TlpA family protein disulfide reductase [Acidobacteriota bacterium]|nr:TlpA family protein disulfide reductase [Acidobacteriota bacterium]